MNPEVDPYFTDGCGRCPLGGTPACKVHLWPEELRQLRRIVLSTGLTEALKWGVPTYTFQGKNVAIVSAFKEYCALSFFKGVLLEDAHQILQKPGENTQSARLIRFTDTRQLVEMEPILKAYLFEAMEVEKAGLKVEFKKVSAFSIPEEFQQKLQEHPDLKAAFEALTPGRQRGYLLHFSQPKQAKTREARVEKCIPKILDGKGMQE
ncbi:MAG: YdeI/OmpD-associated family protein [Bacteroidia bacterium]|nr:YdeI/OmpD-associated family protein [Bacteroidia bacterium]